MYEPSLPPDLAAGLELRGMALLICKHRAKTTVGSHETERGGLHHLGMRGAAQLAEDEACLWGLQARAWPQYCLWDL